MKHSCLLIRVTLFFILAVCLNSCGAPRRVDRRDDRRDYRDDRQDTRQDIRGDRRYDRADRWGY